MTISFEGEIHDARSAENNEGLRTYSATYLLITSVKTETAYDVGSHASLPKIGDYHADDINATCRSLRVWCFDGKFGFNVTAEWSTQRELNEDPEKDEVMVSWSSEIYQEPLYEDINGLSIVNSCGDYFLDPLIQRDNTHLIAAIKANVRQVPTWVLTKQNNVNNNNITIGGLQIAAGKARMSRLRIGERQRRNNYDFYALSFEVHIHENGWRSHPLDAGFRERVYGKPVQIVNEGDGEEVTAPVPLNGNGQALQDPTPANAVFLEFQIYTESDLTSLPGIS